MSNPFKPQRGPIDKLKRNVYDLSFGNNLSVNFGTLYPVFCKKVSPGDSMSIDTVFGLRAQPMIFPVQTKMRADVHFFYVRNRTLWSDWMDFYGKTGENLEHPYIDRPIKDFKTKSIYDFFGVTTTIMSGQWYSEVVGINPYDPYNTSTNSTASLRAIAMNELSIQNSTNKFFDFVNRKNFPYTSNIYISLVSSSTGLLGGDIFANPEKNTRIGQITGFMPLLSKEIYESNKAEAFKYGFPNIKGLSSFVGQTFYVRPYFFLQGGTLVTAGGAVTYNNSDFQIAWHYAQCNVGTGSFVTATLKESSGHFYLECSPGILNLLCESEKSLELQGSVSNGYGTGVYYCFAIYPNDSGSGANVINSMSATNEDGKLLSYNDSNFCGFGNLMQYKTYADKIIDASALDSLPWCGPDKTLKINALPYRAYEAIYNSFYRNVQIDPFKLNGKDQYNRYVTNLYGGSDATPYKLFQRNYEYDFLTGAFHSPQQGLAPLVGLTVSNADQTATFKFSSPSINNGAEITATTSITDDGQVVGITGYDPDLPQSNIDRLMQAINYGISINDIRQTNSLQKWLEKNIRRGYRYKDQIFSHFGVSLDYDELLMPEFIGGVSQDINTDTIYQTATNENGYLGDIAGRAGVVGSSRHKVSKYCPEAGFIIGIMSIVPTPVYSQVPAGYCFDNNLFDYFFPEFSKIGMQPIYNYQVTPLQAGDKLHDVFGYQRPYWDLIRSIDEVHGEFRTTANGYLIQRHFKDTPILNKHFLEINSDSLNDVFMITDTEVSDQFKGQIYFTVTKKTPIPLFGIPSIE